jgi:hypothetical protein
LWWRLSLGVVSELGPKNWIVEIQEAIHHYSNLKKEILLVLAEATADPLSQLTSISSPNGGEWSKFYQVRLNGKFSLNYLYST